MKRRIKTGDTVLVLTGDFKGEKGKVIAVLPKKDRAVLDMIGLSPEKQGEIGMRTLRRSQQNPKGGRIERKVSVHISNLKVLEEAKKEEKRAKRTEEK